MTDKENWKDKEKEGPEKGPHPINEDYKKNKDDDMSKKGKDKEGSQKGTEYDDEKETRK